MMQLYFKSRILRQSPALLFLLAFNLVFFSPLFSQTMGIRAAIGQFASQAEYIDGSTGNAFLLGLNLQPKGAFRIDVGVRYNGVNETKLDVETYEASFLTVRSITRKMAYTGVYAAPGVNVQLSQIGSGVGAYAYIGGGLGFSTVINKVEFTDTAATPSYVPKTNHDNWKPFGLVGAGLKAQIFYIGIFGEFSYFDGKPVEYEHITAYDIEVMPGGTISPKGFAAYVGLCWN